jgi:hypothetical protein
MPKTVINDRHGVVQGQGFGLTIENDVVFMGKSTFQGPAVGLPTGEVTRCTDIAAPSAVHDYDCSGGVRFFRHRKSPEASWSANFKGLNLTEGTVVTVKVAVPSADLTDHFIEDVLVEGEAVSSFMTTLQAGLKVKKGGKMCLATFDIMRATTGAIHVYADALQDLVP